MRKTKSIFYFGISPFVLTASIALISIFMNLIIYFSGGDGYEKNIWTFNVSTLLLFALFNSILLFSSSNKNYFLYSVISYIGLAAFVVFLSQFVTGIPLEEAWSVKWLMGVVTFAYVMIFTIVNIIKKIIELAKRHESKLRSNN
jgi:peptidoglycan/LPS O-acetylase OafA/YrhL